MKRSILLLSLSLSCLSAPAQGLSGGLKFGVNLSSQEVESSSALDRKGWNSVHVGAFATMMFGESFGIQPEVVYSQLGSKYDMGSFGFISHQLRYLTIPLMLRYQVVPVFHVHAGPQFGFLLSADQKLNNSQDIRDSYEGSDIGAGIGAGLDLPMGLGITARYVLGLTNISNPEVNASDRIVNNVLQFSATYRLFGKKGS